MLKQRCQEEKRGGRNKVISIIITPTTTTIPILTPITVSIAAIATDATLTSTSSLAEPYFSYQS